VKKTAPLDELLKQKDETATLDFKRAIKLLSDNEKYEFAKDVSAFGNSKGGVLLYGKEDPKEGGKIVGINSESYDADKMQQIVSSRVHPPVEFSSEIIKRGSRFFALVKIPESKLKPHEITSTREVWIRRGGTTDRATQRERDLMSLQKDRTRITQKKSIKEQIETEGIPEKPEGWGKRTVISIGRVYTQRVHGKLDVSLLKEEIILAAMSLLCFAPIAYWVYVIYSNGTVVVPMFSVISAFLAIFGVILFYGLMTIESLKCPQCKRHFGLRRTQHIRVKDREIDRTEEYVKREVTYNNAYACEFCKYKIPKIETETETINL